MKSKSLLKSLSLLLGHKGWVNAKESKPWQRDWFNKYGELPLGVARPCSTKEVSQVLSLCSEYGVHVVPQGGNTGLVAGGVLGLKNGVILSLDRMNEISLLDKTSNNISVGAGVILEHLHQFLEGTGLMFPLHLGSEGSAQIGGLVATNAGGSHAFRYGMMYDLVLGLELVLSDGRVWDGMRAVQKDNAGYQLRKLICGSEGTLGVVTKAFLKLYPEPKQEFTAILAVKDSLSLIELAQKLKSEAGEFLTAMEFFSDVGLGIALENISGLVYPLQRRSSFYLLVEVSSGSKKVPLESILTDIIQDAISDDIVLDGALAQSESQRSVFWRLREEQPEGQRRHGAQLKHDISVPPGSIDEFLKIADEQCCKILCGVQINAFGHLGDGNIHYNLSPPMGEKDFSGLESELSMNLASLASKMNGSFAAEHGLGRTKIMLADSLRGQVERDMMRCIKNSFDDRNHLNPGVLIHSQNL